MLLPAAAFAEESGGQNFEIIVRAARAPAAPSAGQTVTSVGREDFANQPAATIGEILVQQPGITVQQGNGPRDVSLSVRGSNARNTFGVRNVQVFEDGFPVTQPDGLARTDLTDPHAYDRIDVAQGPSSAQYGNYATGGAILFHTRSGREIDGFELGFDGGEFGYRNYYAALGAAGTRYDLAGFASLVRGDGFTAHTGYNTSTQNVRAEYAITPRDRLVFKVIHNDLDADLSIRLSLNQFRANPYQLGCDALALTNCASVRVFANGMNGAQVNLTPEQAGLSRDDTRTIIGARWEHAFSAETAGRVQLVWDNRDITQPTSNTAAIGTFPSYNLMADVTHAGTLFGAPATLQAGVWSNYEDNNSYTYNLMPGGNARIGALTRSILGHHGNSGVRLRAELAPHAHWAVVLGLAGEVTRITAVQTAITYPALGAPGTARIEANRRFTNVAPEVAVWYEPRAGVRLRGRVAAGYGTPQISNLFVTPAGVAGPNLDLNAQRNIGVDLGGDFDLTPDLRVSVTGFYEWFRDELVSQSAGANLLSYTFNAPRSEHRGVQIGLDWRPLPETLHGLTARFSYMLNDQVYDDYSERLSAGAFSNVFDRGGNAIPGVVRNSINARVAYAQESGPLAGLGGYVEVNGRDDYFLDNANLLEALGYELINLGVHYDPPEGPLARLRFYASLQNATDEIYIGSASNVANSISSVTGAQNGLTTLEGATGSIYAGAPRTFVAGVRVQF